MYSDVLELHAFYETTRGQVALRLIREALRQHWPEVRGQRLLGLGYAVPYLRPFREEAERVLAVMPPGQGVMPWPHHGLNQALLADEAELPLPDNSIDRVLLVHALEGTERRHEMLRELWRVMCGGARMILVVPNRTGLWARAEGTPFGHGRPYTRLQLEGLLDSNLFALEAEGTALFVPPFNSRLFLRAARSWEGVGRRWAGGFAGVHLIEVSKQVMPVVPAHEPRRRLRDRFVLPLPIPGRPAGATRQPPRRSRNTACSPKRFA